jgi:glycosyltransferase involved in cell wall biosynthesis
VKILFPYLARARSANWSRYQQLLAARARAGDRVRFLEAPARESDETNFRDLAIDLPAGFEIEEVPGARWIARRRLPFDKIVQKGAAAIASNRRVREILDREPPDVLLVYNVTHASLLGRGVMTVFDVADDLPEMLRVEGGGGLAGGLMAAAARRVLRRMLARATIVTTPSRVLVPELGPRAQFVPNGVDPAEIEKARRGAAGRPRTAGPRIGFLGSFEYFIDFDFVLDLARQLPGAEFLLIGGGRRYAEVRAGIEAARLGNLALTGPLPHPEALRRLAECDLSLCPFLRNAVGHGASPLKLFESLALGVPVIALPTRELEAERPANVMFVGSAPEGAAAVERWSAIPAERRAQESEAARRRVVEERSWDRIGANWAELVRERN